MSDENQYLEQAQQAQYPQYTPAPQEDAPAEAEAPATQAVASDPFADEDDEQAPGTAAVAFDPFADDDDDDEEFDIAELLGRGSSSSSVTTQPGAQTPDPSMASPRTHCRRRHGAPAVHHNAGSARCSNE